ncbi:retrovirus-related pol polyprotein from transposon TNT 1-94 [Tanacetum coccineum]
MTNEKQILINFDMTRSARIMKLSKDMQLIQKLCDDQKRMKKVLKSCQNYVQKIQYQNWVLVEKNFYVNLPHFVRLQAEEIKLEYSTCKDYELEQLDVKTAFLHGNLKEVIYMRQPQGYEQGGSISNSFEDIMKAQVSVIKASATLNIQAFKIKKSVSISFRMTQVHKMAKDHMMMIRDYDWMMISKKLKDHIQVKLKPKSRSITSYIFLVHGCVVSWKATLQHVVALSTTEAEYMALTEAVKEAIWLRGLLEELGVELNTVAVNCDNQGAIHLSRNHVFHERTKHINVRYHFIREVLEAKTVKVLKVGTEHNVADALTKAVPRLKLQYCLELLNVGVG